MLHALRLGDHEGANNSEVRIPLKVWNMMAPESRIAMRSGEEVNIGLVKDSDKNTVKHGRGCMSQQNKNNRAKFL